MKSLSTVLLILITLVSLHAQSYTVDWGPEQRKQGGLFPRFYFGGFTGDNYHVVLEPLKEPTLISYGPDHRVRKVQSIDFGRSRKTFFFGGFYPTRAGMFGLFTEVDRRADQLRTYASPFDGTDFGDLREVYTQEDYKGKGEGAVQGMYTGKEQDLFERIVMSPDHDKVLITNTPDAKERMAQQELSIAVLDANFELLWEKQHRFAESDFDLKILRSVVSNQGNVYLLTKLEDPKLLKGLFNQGLDEDRYQIHQITADGSKVMELELGASRTAQFTGIYVSDKEEDVITIAGIYSDPEKRKGLDGIFNLRTNAEFEVISTNTFPFEQEFMEGLISKRASKKDRGLDANFLVRTFFEFEDETIGFVAEKTYVVTVSNPQTRSTTVTYHTDELVVAIFNPTLDAVNVQKVEKRFGSQAFSLVSYGLGVHENGLHLVYNNSKTREERKELSGSGKRRGAFTDLVVIGKDGSLVHQQNLFNSAETDKLFVAKQSGYNHNRMLLLTHWGKYYQCGLLPLE